MMLDRNDVRMSAGANLRWPAAATPIVPVPRAGALARRFCRDVAHAEVAAVFERAFYLRAADSFVCLGEPSIGNGPLTMIADLRNVRLSDLGIYPGQVAAISNQRIAIGASVEFSLDRCEVWHPRPWPVAQPPSGLIDSCHAIIGVMTNEAPDESFARAFCVDEHGTSAAPLARAARQRMAGFETWLRDVLETSVPAAVPLEPVHGMIGMGHGLTPSGDDFLVGALALLNALAQSRAHAALAQAINLAPAGLTSALSRCLLRAATAGDVGENLRQAVSAVVSGNLDVAFEAIQTIGHSSGWDMLAGIVTTLGVVIDARQNPDRITDRSSSGPVTRRNW